MHKNSSWDHFSCWKIDYQCPCHFIAVRRIQVPNLTWRWHYPRKNHFPFLCRGLFYKVWTSFSTFRYTLFSFDWSLSSSSRQVIKMYTKSLFISVQFNGSKYYSLFPLLSPRFHLLPVWFQFIFLELCTFLRHPSSVCTTALLLHLNFQ